MTAEELTLLDMLASAKGVFSRLESEDDDTDIGDLKLPSIYKIHDYDTQGNRPIGTYSCGSERMEDTPLVLYRAMFLFRPERVSFKDMYKDTFLTLVSPDYKLVADIEFFKFEIGVYFSAAREYIPSTQGHGVIAGHPGADNGVTFAGEIPSLWFGLLVKLLRNQWMVYSGNNFEV